MPLLLSGQAESVAHEGTGDVLTATRYRRDEPMEKERIAQLIGAP